MLAVYRVFLFNTRQFSTIAVQSFNCVLRNTTVHELVFNSLSSCIADELVVKLSMFMLLVGTYEQSIIAKILIERINKSKNPKDLVSICIKIFHEFGLKAGFTKRLNLDFTHEQIMSSVNHYRQPSERFTYLWPKYHERLNSFNLVSRVGCAFYAWNVFRMDDFHFTMKEYSISPKLKINWIDEKSPPMLALNIERVPIEEEEGEDEAEDIKINELIWIRPKGQSRCSKYGSQRQLRSSLDGTNPFNTKNRSSFKPEPEDSYKEIDIESMDAIFDCQLNIEENNQFDSSMYEPLINKQSQEERGDKQEITGNSYDDCHLLFHGLARDIQYSALDSESSMGDFFRNTKVVMLMKCYKSSYRDDQELRNLVKSLGTRFECLPDLVLPYSVPKNPIGTTKNSLDQKTYHKEVIVIQGIGSLTYVIIDNDHEVLEKMMADPVEVLESSCGNKSPNFCIEKSHLPFLILYGFDTEIEDYKKSHLQTLNQFSKIIGLSKSFDVDVLQMKVTQVSSA